jgi:hypothetical protein
MLDKKCDLENKLLYIDILLLQCPTTKQKLADFVTLELLWRSLIDIHVVHVLANQSHLKSRTQNQWIPTTYQPKLVVVRKTQTENILVHLSTSACL